LLRDKERLTNHQLRFICEALSELGFDHFSAIFQRNKKPYSRSKRSRKFQHSQAIRPFITARPTGNKVSPPLTLNPIRLAIWSRKKHHGNQLNWRGDISLSKNKITGLK